DPRSGGSFREEIEELLGILARGNGGGATALAQIEIGEQVGTPRTHSRSQRGKRRGTYAGANDDDRSAVGGHEQLFDGASGWYNQPPYSTRMTRAGNVEARLEIYLLFGGLLLYLIGHLWLII